MSQSDERDRVDPAIRAAQQAMLAANPPFDVTLMPIGEARACMASVSAWWSDGGPAVEQVRDLSIDGPQGPMRARLYLPGAAPGGCLLFVHGGGWALGSVDTHDRTMRCLALESGMAVLGIDYRLAPEHLFPAPLEDCQAAWRWLAENRAGLGIGDGPIFVGGDSAGGNLAVALALSAADAGLSRPDGVVSFYGCFLSRPETDSYRAFGDGRYGLSEARMAWYWAQYGAAGRALAEPAAALGADLGTLPPTYLAIAELDVVADDSRRLAAALASAGVEHELVEWRGAVHGFLQMTRDVPMAREALAHAGAWMQGRAAAPA